MGTPPPQTNGMTPAGRASGLFMRPRCLGGCLAPSSPPRDPHELLPEGRGRLRLLGLHRGQDLEKGHFVLIRHVLIKGGKVVLLEEIQSVGSSEL